MHEKTINFDRIDFDCLSPAFLIPIKYILPLASGCLAHRPQNSLFGITEISQGEISRVPV